MSTSVLDQAAAELAGDSKSSKPVQTFRYHNLSASVFENPSKNGGMFFTVSLQRTYKDGDEFKRSSSFTRDDIPVVRHLLAKAWVFILDSESTYAPSSGDHSIGAVRSRLSTQSGTAASDTNEDRVK